MHQRTSNRHSVTIKLILDFQSYVWDNPIHNRKDSMQTKEIISALKDTDTFLITYYAKKYRAIITRKGKTDHKTKTWITPKGSYCFCYYDLDAETMNPYRTATNPTRIELI